MKTSYCILLLLSLMVMGCEPKPVSPPKEAPKAPEVIEAPVSNFDVLVLPVRDFQKSAELGQIIQKKALEAKAMVHDAPMFIARNLTGADANRLKTQLHEIGLDTRLVEAGADTYTAPEWSMYSAKQRARFDGESVSYRDVKIGLVGEWIQEIGTEASNTAEVRSKFTVDNISRPPEGGFILFGSTSSEWGKYKLRVENQAGDPRVRVSLSGKLKQNAFVKSQRLEFDVVAKSMNGFTSTGWVPVSKSWRQDRLWPTRIRMGQAIDLYEGEVVEFVDVQGGPDNWKVAVHADLNTLGSADKAAGVSRTRREPAGPMKLEKKTKVEMRFGFVLGTMSDVFPTQGQSNSVDWLDVRMDVLPTGFVRLRNPHQEGIVGMALQVPAGVEIRAVDGQPLLEGEQGVELSIPGRGERLLRLFKRHRSHWIASAVLIEADPKANSK